MKRPKPRQQSKLTEIPFAELKPSAVNVRRTDPEAGVDEMVALIRAKGLLQPLIVRTAKGGGYEVTAGGRRLAAIGRLIEAGEWQGPVPCYIREESDAEARDTSLVENVGRLPMHPVDQFEAFAGLDMPAADIAARYGISEQSVQERLALGRLHEDVRAAWRAGELDAGTAQAFTLSPDQKRQGKVLAELRKAGAGVARHMVRRALVQDRPRTDDARVLTVGLEAYRAAGGDVDQDLFSEHGYVCDVPLLEELLGRRLQQVCDELLAQGWGEAIVEREDLQIWRWPRELPAGSGKPTAEQKARLAALDAQLDDLENANDADDDDHDRLEFERGQIEADIAARGYTKAQRAALCCVVSVDDHGLAIVYGRRRPPETMRTADGPPATIEADDVKPDPADPHAVPLALLGDIGAAQTAAVVACLRVVPNVAVQAAAAALRSTFEAFGTGNAPVRLRAHGLNQRRPGFDDEPSDAPIDDKGTASSGFAAAMRDIHIDLAPLALADELARAVDCRDLKFKPVCRLDLDALVGALPVIVYEFELRKGLSLEEYFERATARACAAALEEMGGVVANGAKKADLAAAAARFAADCGWLPPAIRHPAYKLKRRIDDPPAKADTARPAKAQRARARS